MRLSDRSIQARIALVEAAAYVTLGVVAILVAALVALRPWPFPPSVTTDELLGFARLGRTDGVDAMSKFYGWRQDQWSLLARGFGAFAVAVLLALVAASLEAGKRVLEQSPNQRGSETTKITITESQTSPEVLALVGALVVFGGSAWFRARALQREFSDDVARLTLIP
jgi:hypothetical protein